MQTTVQTLVAIYNDSYKQIENLKRELCEAAMRGRTKRVEELTSAIIKYENDMTNFIRQTVEYRAVGERKGGV